MKTFLLAAMLALTAVSGIAAATQQAAAEGMTCPPYCGNTGWY